jgi:uncharacterized membrane protein
MCYVASFVGVTITVTMISSTACHSGQQYLFVILSTTNVVLMLMIPTLSCSHLCFALESCFWLNIAVLILVPGFAAMGLFRGSFTLLVGMGCGVYIAQNYNVPNVKKLFNTYVFLAKHIEETYRKPKKKDDD